MDNNCCAKGMQQPAPAISNIIQGTMDAYAIVTNKYVIAHDVGAATLHMWYETGYHSFTGYAGQLYSYVTGAIKGVAESAMNSLGVMGAAASTSVVMPATSISAYAMGQSAEIGSTQAAGITQTISNYSGVTSTASDAAAFQSGAHTNISYLEQFKAAIQAALKAVIKWILQKVFHIAARQAGEYAASFLKLAGQVFQFLSAVMAIYSAYQLAYMLASMLTQCKSEDFKLGFMRKEHLCHMVGTYCKDSLPIFGCQMTATTFCCYPSPLVNIIMSQIQDAQPQIAGGYGSPKNPNCGGLTIPELAQVNWSKVNLSQWLAMLQSSGLIQTTNSSAAAMNTPYQMAHPSGQVSPTSALPTTIQ